jgi:hypothetical protein
MVKEIKCEYGLTKWQKEKLYLKVRLQESYKESKLCKGGSYSVFLFLLGTYSVFFFLLDTLELGGFLFTRAF